MSQRVSWNKSTISTEKRKQKQHYGETKDSEVKAIKKVPVCSPFGELFHIFEDLLVE